MGDTATDTDQPAWLHAGEVARQGARRLHFRLDLTRSPVRIAQASGTSVLYVGPSRTRHTCAGWETFE